MVINLIIFPFDFRYNTYTITSDESRENSMEPETRPSPVNESDSHSSEDAVKKMSPKEKFQIKRSSEKDRFRTRTLADLDLTDIVRSRSKDNFAAAEYSKDSFDESTTSEGTNGGYSSDENSSNVPAGSARIVKPPADAAKAVRGKKKSSRGSGIPTIVARSSPQPPPPPPTVTKSSQSTPTKKPAPLKRQGTFTKEESRIPTPGSSGKKHTSVPNLVKPPPTNNNRQSSAKRGAGGGVRNSVSNNSLKSGGGDQWAGSNSSLPTMGGAAKTNSNTSLNSNISATSSGCSAKTAPVTKKDATSKITSLWKQVEKNKKNNVGGAKDNRVWIGPNNRV